jgi:hypothetical protein
MVEKKGKRTIFNSKALVEFFLACLVLGFLIALHSKTIDTIWIFLWLGFILVGSVVVLWRIWKHPDELKHRGMGQVSALPWRWQKWVLGENDKDSSR